MTKIHAPNGLPTPVTRFDGVMLECEHGDHDDYAFPVRVLGEERDPEYPSFPETHALIYTDGSVAVTLHECNYSMWSVYTGECLGGRYHDKTNRLDEESRLRVESHASKQLDSKWHLRMVASNVEQNPADDALRILLRLAAIRIRALLGKGSPL